MLGNLLKHYFYRSNSVINRNDTCLKSILIHLQKNNLRLK